MNQVVAVDAKIVRNILTTVEELKKEMSLLREKFEGAPPYGSDKWWKWSEKKADEDIKVGRVSGALHNKKELQEFLDLLKTP